MKGIPAEERAERRRKAIEAFEKVIAFFPNESREVAQAQYEIGELYRKLKQVHEAQKAFEKALAFPAVKGPYADSLLALAGLHFKAGDHDRAVARLGKLLADCPGRKRACGEGLLLWARCLWEKGEMEGLRNVLFRLTREYPRSTVRLVRAYDLIAQSYLREGKLDAAQKSLQACRDTLLEGADSEEERDARMRRFEKMKAIELLEEARRRGGSFGDGKS
jgi:tetratricopeptide (TPR) repeat protein